MLTPNWDAMSIGFTNKYRQVVAECDKIKFGDQLVTIKAYVLNVYVMYVQCKYGYKMF